MGFGKGSDDPVEIEREKALEELMSKDDDELGEDFPEEDSGDLPEE